MQLELSSPSTPRQKPVVFSRHLCRLTAPSEVHPQRQYCLRYLCKSITGGFGRQQLLAAGRFSSSESLPQRRSKNPTGINTPKNSSPSSRCETIQPIGKTRIIQPTNTGRRNSGYSVPRRPAVRPTATRPHPAEDASAVTTNFAPQPPNTIAHSQPNCRKVRAGGCH
jgi:hypothetical protein